MSMLLRKFSQIKKEENKVRLTDLVDWINEVRKEEGINSKVNYADFNRKIKKYNEAISERGLRKISSTFYVDSWNRKQKTYLLSKHEAMIFASGESDIIKAMVIQYMDNLEFEFNIVIASKEQTKLIHDGLYELIKEFKDESVNSEYSKINSFINMTVAKKFGIKQGELKKENMSTEQLEFRALVESKWLEYYQGKKSGIKAKIEEDLL